MANIGLSRPFVAKYAATNGTVSYTEGKIFGKAVSVSISIDGAEQNIMYADDGPAESAYEFTGGKLSLTTDEFLQEDEAFAMGLTEKTVTVAGITGKDIKEIAYESNIEPPYLGFGIIRKKKKNGKEKYQAIILTKIQFSAPAEEGKTQGKTIEWGNPSLEATIMRDDSEAGCWAVKCWLDSEADAEAYIKHKLSIA